MHRALPLVLALVVLAVAAPAAADTHAIRCGTPELLPGLPTRVKPAPTPPAAAGGKLVRDGFGGPFAGVRESANFAVKWQSAAVSEEKAQIVLDTLETSWLVFAALGHGGPTGTETYKLNAYIHGATDNPPIDFDGGYAWIDDGGYPYFVISANISDEEALQHVTAHELYHDYQLSLPAFGGQTSYWFWEATADWAAQEVFPALSRPYAFVGAYALAPELPLFFAGDPFGEDPIAGVHQYGSSIFPRYLTDRIDDPTLVARAWETAGGGDDPLRVLDDLLPDGEIAGELSGAFGAFAAANATWDYAQRDRITPWVDYYQAAFPARTLFHATVWGEGSGGFQSIDGDRALRSFGYHHLRIVRPAAGAVEITVEVDAQGSSGTTATWHATFVRDVADADPEYVPIPLSGGAGELVMTLPEGEDIHYLAIAVTGDARDDGETFGYRYRVRPTAAVGPDAGPGEDPDDPAGCCSTGRGPGGAPGAALLTLVVALCFRRSRFAGAR